MQKHIVVNAKLIFGILEAAPEWLSNRTIKRQQIFWVMIELRHTVQDQLQVSSVFEVC